LNAQTWRVLFISDRASHAVLGVGVLRDRVDEFLGVRLAFFHRPARAVAVRRLRYTAYPAELTQFSTAGRAKKRAILAKRLNFERSFFHLLANSQALVLLLQLRRLAGGFR
jgi:hypothetical protein